MEGTSIPGSGMVANPLKDNVAIFCFLLLTSGLNATIDDFLEHLFDLVDSVAFRKLQKKISEREQ
jgi:hypothetical protein